MISRRCWFDCAGPRRVSQGRVRAACSELGLSSLVALDKTDSFVVTQPMVPLVDQWLVQGMEEVQATVEPSPDVNLGNSVSTAPHAASDPANSEVWRRKLDEMDGHPVAALSPTPDLRRVQTRRERRLDCEGLLCRLGLGQEAKELAPGAEGSRFSCLLHFVGVEKQDLFGKLWNEEAGERGLPGTVRTCNQDRFRHGWSMTARSVSLSGRGNEGRRSGVRGARAGDPGRHRRSPSPDRRRRPLLAPSPRRGSRASS